MITKVHSSSIDWTAVGAIGTWATFAAVPASAVLVWVQLRQAKHATQSQVYQTLLDRAERIRLNEALDTVRDLRCTTFDDFRQITPSSQDKVRLVAEFFNEIQHMLPPEARMLELKYVEHLWAQSILNCTDKLWAQAAWNEDEPRSWWLDGIRGQGGYFYKGFEHLCWAIRSRDLKYRIARGETTDARPNLKWKKPLPKWDW